MNQSNRYRGKLFVLEGLDGSGKSSLLKKLVATLQAKFPQISILRAKEPGHTYLGEQIRKLLLCTDEKKENEPTPLAECLLFNAARSQLVETFLKPELERGTWIFLDRFTLSSYAYQGASKNIKSSFLDLLIKESAQGIVPDLTLFLKAPWSFCKNRLKQSTKNCDRIECSSDEFFENVERCYDQAIQDHEQPLVFLNAQLSKRELVFQALKALDPYLK